MMKNTAAKKILGNTQHIHFVGIGGIGMSGIAQVLLSLGYTVSGSDLNENQHTQHLQQRGATITIGHNAKAINGADVVVKSTAIQDNNPEIIAAKQRKLAVIPRAEMLAELMRNRYGIAVSGTHGKTTTTSLITAILSHAQLDPTYVIGGCLTSEGNNAYLGSGNHLIAEADESDASFLLLRPMIAVITNIDADHMSTYADDFSRLSDSFRTFIQQLPFYGLAVVCADDPNLQAIMPTIDRPLISYGFDSHADIQAVDYKQQGLQSHFGVKRPGSNSLLDIQINLPGHHNVLNALAAICIATELGVSDHLIQQALASFAGIGRRFQIYEPLNTSKAKITLVDDYGHHPRELESTIAGVRAVWPERRLVMVFQPHRYSRTQDLLQEFAQTLTKVDQLVLLPVYAAGEKIIETADSNTLAQIIVQSSSLNPLLVDDEKQLSQCLSDVLINDDILLTQGAGDIGKMAQHLARLWQTP